jgi:toxin ParE1/3/4
MPNRNVILRPAAEDDLTGIYRDIAARSGYPERAIGYVRRIRAFCDTLVSFPERGQRRDDLRVIRKYFICVQLVLANLSTLPLT